MAFGRKKVQELILKSIKNNSNYKYKDGIIIYEYDKLVIYHFAAIIFECKIKGLNMRKYFEKPHINGFSRTDQIIINTALQTLDFPYYCKRKNEELILIDV